MKINKKGIELIKQCEGCRLTAYKCPAGVLTIGYGHTKGVKIGDKITQDQADKYLLEDIKEHENNVNNINRTYKYKFNKNQFAALVSFSFNCGNGNLLQLCQHGLRTKEEIGNCIKLYNKANGKTLDGLVVRRSLETKLYNTPMKDEV